MEPSGLLNKTAKLPTSLSYVVALWLLCSRYGHLQSCHGCSHPCFPGRGLWRWHSHKIHRPDGNLFNLNRLRAVTKISVDTVFGLQYADGTAFPSHSGIGLQCQMRSPNAAYSRAGLVVNREILAFFRDSRFFSKHLLYPSIKRERWPVVHHREVHVSEQCSYNNLRSVCWDSAKHQSTFFMRPSCQAGFHQPQPDARKWLFTITALFEFLLSCIVVGSGQWTPYHHIRCLEKLHIRCLQTILNLYWWNKVPCTEILVLLVLPSLENTTATQVAQLLCGELRHGTRSSGG